MAVVISKPQTLSFEDYLNEGETPGRYEIIDGIRQYMTNPSPQHQIILRNIARAFEDCLADSYKELVFVAPLDIIITKAPLHIRQPDVMVISTERWADHEFTDASPLKQSPELVVEIISPSESKRRIENKVREYAAVGVRECWLVTPQSSTVERINLVNGYSNDSTFFRSDEIVSSIAFPEIKISLAQMFRLPKLSR